MNILEELWYGNLLNLFVIPITRKYEPKHIVRSVFAIEVTIPSES